MSNVLNIVLSLSIGIFKSLLLAELPLLSLLVASVLAFKDMEGVITPELLDSRSDDWSIYFCIEALFGIIF